MNNFINLAANRSRNASRFLPVISGNDFVHRTPSNPTPTSYGIGIALPALSGNRFTEVSRRWFNTSRVHQSFGSYIIREAVHDEDYLARARLHVIHTLEGEESEYLCPLDEKFMKECTQLEYEDLKEESKKQEFHSLVAVKGDEIVGALDLRLDMNWKNEVLSWGQASDSKLDSYVTNVFVSKCSRRKKIASNLVETALKIAASKGMKMVYLFVAPWNDAAFNCYQKQGFECLGEYQSENLMRKKLE